MLIFKYNVELLKLNAVVPFSEQKMLFVRCLVCVFMSVCMYMCTNECKSQRMTLDLILRGSCVFERG